MRETLMMRVICLFAMSLICISAFADPQGEADAWVQDFGRYMNEENWPKAMATFLDRAEKFGGRPTIDAIMGGANVMTVLFVLHCDDIKTLNKVAEWEKVDLGAGDYGNYAALLYKAGR